ncbi:MAG: di-heme-cytochrome C peroxidase [Aliidongia sp.]
MNTKSSLRIGTAALALSGVILVGCHADNGPPPPPPIAVPPAPPAGTGLVYTDQGKDWADADRVAFYSGGQGSEIMPLSWIKALKLLNGTPFLAGNLGRYGYLPNPASPAGLPIGFTAAPAGAPSSPGAPPGVEQFGMTCAACHTREIDVAGRPYRIDGGPGIVDFQPFLADLDASMKNVRDNPAAFKEFAHVVLGAGDKPASEAKLKSDVKKWLEPYDALIQAALPSPAWGPSRLDAVGMIFDRLTGLDLGDPKHDYLIRENLKRADAPTRYPFLWNAAIQDQTQWPGFASNGTDILGLARNLGEVYGVFGTFHPKKNDIHLFFGANYIKNNSADFSGLGNLENLIKKLGPPKWPWTLDQTLVAAGKAVYEGEGGCFSCHAVPPNVPAGAIKNTWKTPITPLEEIGTDTREQDILKWTAKSGVLEGAGIPIAMDPLKPVDTSINILSVSVLGSILQYKLPLTQGLIVQPSGAKGKAAKSADQSVFTPEEADLKQAFHTEATSSKPPPGYESRVLQGVWAAAPYLHNGSVPSLAELLKPPAERVASFKIGPAYDIDNVGLAAVQTKFDYVLNTTGCDHLDSGNSRCGHDFGTHLSPENKRALLEYLKSL